MKNAEYEQTAFNMVFGNVTESYEHEDGQKDYRGYGTTDNGSVKNFISLLDEDTLKALELIAWFPRITDTDIEPISPYSGDGFTVAFRLCYSEREKALAVYGQQSAACGRYLTDSEYVSECRYITLPSGYTEEYIGDMVQINGRHYEVVGVEYMDDSVNMLYVNSPDDMTVSSISLSFNELIGEKSYEGIKAACNEAFGDNANLPKLDTISENQPFYNSIIAISVMLLVLSSVTLTILYKYILQKRSKTTAIMRINGCSRNKAR